MSDFEKMFDVNALTALREKFSGKLRIEYAAKEFGLSKAELHSVKTDRKLKKRYQAAASQSLYLFKGETVYGDFLERLAEWKDNEDWTALDVLGYFCHKYETTNKTDFIFAITSNPFSSKETKLAAQLVEVFKSRQVLKAYIDWSFDVKNRGSFKIFGIAVLLSSWLINEFNMFTQKDQKKVRTSQLPEVYIEWCRENIPKLFEENELENYGNLATFKGMIERGYASNEMKLALEKAEEMKILEG